MRRSLASGLGTGQLRLVRRGDHADCLFVPLQSAAGRRQAGATKLDGEPSQRAIAVIAAETVDRLNLMVTEGLAVYTPITKRYVAQHR